LILPAASSIARGNPSRRMQISATTAALVAVRAKSGLTATARCTNSATDATCARSTLIAFSRLGSGKAKGGTGNSCSPYRCRVARLVTKSLSRGHSTSSAATRGAAPTTCSKLSSTSNSCRSRRKSFRLSNRARVPASRRSNAWAIAGMTRVESVMGARETK
jgi:hypothetical protein